LNLLAVDTSTRSTVLGLQVQDRVLDGSTKEVQTHSRDILPSISGLLEEAEITLSDLDAIVFGQGPGSFTGLRIAVGVVQGLAYGLDIPVVPISSMRCLAQSLAHGRAHKVFVALHARLEEIYYGTYRLHEGLAFHDGDESVLDVSKLELLDDADWTLMGNGLFLRSKIENSTGVTFESVVEESVPRVEGLLSLGLHELKQGGAISALNASPVYLRETVADRPGKRKS
jgi:tRNA threonylcarbamoyladenosine biosynthesis protein TsaB